MPRVRMFLCVLSLLAICAGCGGPGTVWKTPEPQGWERQAAGSRLWSTPYPPSRWLKRAELVPTVDRIVKRIAPATDRICGRTYATGCERIPWKTVLVVEDNPSINAFVDQNNQVRIFGGLVSAAGSDDEIATVLAHENVHIMLGHVGSKISSARRSALLGILLGMGAGYAVCKRCGTQEGYIKSWGDRGAAIGESIGAALYSVEMEREADHIAAYILFEADYDLDKAGLLWVRLFREAHAGTAIGKAALAGFLSTHPSHEHRYAAWQHSVSEVHSGQYRPLLLGE